jgi:hypothetical protein
MAIVRTYLRTLVIIPDTDGTVPAKPMGPEAIQRCATRIELAWSPNVN